MSIFGGVDLIVKCYNPVPVGGKFECFDAITHAKSVVWSKKFYDVGSFQISLLKTDLKRNDIVVHGDNCGIVMKIEKSFEGCEVYGYDLKGLTEFRHIYEPKTYAGDAEMIIKTIAQDTLITGKRAIEGLTIADVRLDIQEKMEWLCDNVNVADTLNRLCKEKELNYDITFSETGLLFDVTKGRDMTENTVFSRKFRNIEDMTHTVDNYSTYNVVLSKVQAEDGTITYTEIGDAEGIFRREYATDKDAETVLTEKREIETMRGTANDRLKYGSDWKNGDYVTCMFGDYVTEKQIVEVKEVYEPGNTKIMPIFGDEKENIIKKILRM